MSNHQETAASNKSKSNTTTSPAKTDNNTAINLSTPSRKVGDSASVNSCLSGPSNPKTLRRTKEGKIQVVHFDERVVVHTVPHWDPSRTQSFSDVSNPANETTCNCCIVKQDHHHHHHHQHHHQEEEQQHHHHQNNKDSENENCLNSNSNEYEMNKGILASPHNPATLRRRSQTDDNNEVSWHKRVVVHRVPRSDASRSMFHAKDKESIHSNQCCIVL